MTALRGVRSSCDMFARNWDLCWRRFGERLPLSFEGLEQAGVVDRQRGLGGERLEQCDNLVWERAGRAP